MALLVGKLGLLLLALAPTAGQLIGLILIDWSIPQLGHQVYLITVVGAVVARRTGLNIVMSTGPYLEKFKGAHSSTAKPADIVRSIDGDLNKGVDETGIKTGMIGEIGISSLFYGGRKIALKGAFIAQAMNPTVPLNIHIRGW